MKIESKKIDDCRTRLTITATPEETKADYDAVVARFVREARLPGFRKGKVPRDLILSRFGTEIQKEVNSNLFRKFYKDAIDREKLDVVALASVEEVIYSPDTGLSIIVQVDLKPTFKLPKYRDLPLEYKAPVVTEEAVSEAEANLRRDYGKFVEGETIAEGDFAKVSFEAVAEKIDPASLPDNARNLLKSDNFWVNVLAQPTYVSIPGIEKALSGLKKGDSFSFETVFPKDGSIAELRGVKASYSGSVLDIQSKVPASDEDLSKALNGLTLDQIRERIKSNFISRGEKAEHDRLASEIRDILTKKASFDVPKTSLETAARGFYDDIVMKAVSSPEEAQAYFESHYEEVHKQALERAEPEERFAFICKAIADEVGIKVTGAEIEARFKSAAEYRNMTNPKDKTTGEQLMRKAVREGRMPLIESGIVIEKVIDWIIDDIKAKK